MEKYDAEEVLTDILRSWDIINLYYFEFYKDNLMVRYGRKDINIEKYMDEVEFNKLLKIVNMLGYEFFIDVY